jgi:hypothetical protein
MRGFSAAAAVSLVLSGAFATSTAHASSRFHGDVAGVASGPGRSFVVGDGLLLRFKDRERNSTRYRVCYTRGHGTSCRQRSTGRRNRYSRIFFAPSGVGTYTARWYVHGRVVASWSWYNGIGD